MGNNLLYNNFIKPHINNKDPFLIYRDGSFTTYKDFISLSKKISQYLVSSQVAKGDRITITFSSPDKYKIEELINDIK